MARKPKNDGEVVVTAQTEALDLSGLETAEDLNPALQRLYAEMGQDEFGKIKVYIYKIDPETGKEPRVWEGAPGDYDLMSVARRFGSADYRVKVHGPHESGRIVIFGNTIFPILLDPADDARIALLREGKLSAQSAAPTQQTLTSEGIAAIVVQAVKAAMPAQQDTFAQMDKLAGVMAKLIPQHNPAPPQQSFTETLAAAKSLLDLTRGMQPPTDGEGRVDAKGMAIARGVDLLAQMFQKSLEPTGAPAVARIGKPGNGALPAPEVREAAQGEQGVVALNADQQEELEMLRMQIKMVNRRAAEGVNPVQLVDQYYDDLPDAIFDNIVFNPQWFEVLCANVPECAPFKDWYVKVRAALIAKGLKENDLQSIADGTLQYVEEPDTTETDGAANA